MSTNLSRGVYVRAYHRFKLEGDYAPSLTVSNYDERIGKLSPKLVEGGH